MLRPMASIGLMALLVAACSSSSSSDAAKPECFNGFFATSYGASSGDPLCADLTAQKDTQIFAVDTKAGTISHTTPTGATPELGIFDEQTCKASEGYTRPAQDPSCPAILDTFDFDLVFTPTGFTGTFKSAVCAKDVSSGAFVTQNCSYPVTATKS